MTHNLALYTFGQFLKPSEDPANDGFHERNDPLFELADATPGLIARSGYPDEPQTESWGEQVYPRFYRDNGDGWAPSTLSVWADAASAKAYIYRGPHLEAMRLGRSWFVEPSWPPLVLWWIAKDYRPTWAEGCTKLEHLQDHGPTEAAFTFRDWYSLPDPLQSDSKS
ncbi:MAG: DUF3291 domain-containing protein [Pseudomonadota bacterium]